MRLHHLAARLSLALALACPSVAALAQDFTTDFFTDECQFRPNGHNLFYFRLHPGDQWYYEGEEDDATIALLVTVLPDIETLTYVDESGATRTVHARIVEEREWEDDELVEVSRNFFARCKQTDSVFYFGEDVDDYEDGEIVGHGGAWRVGEDGALPGVIMPGTVLLGSAYYQEVAPGVALDRAEHVAMGLDMEVEAGSFERCLEVYETSALEPDAESTKVYCPGVGMVIDDDLELVSFELVEEED